MKVLQLISSDGFYGAEKWILALLNAFRKYDIEFSLINLSNSPEVNSEIVTVVKNQGLQAFDFYTKGRFNPVAGMRLGKWIKENNIDIIHSHGFKADSFGLIAAKYSKRKIVSTPHGWSLEKDFKLALYENFDRFLFRFMDFVTPLSPDLYSDLHSTNTINDKMSLIINGVDIEEIDQIEKKNIKKSDEFVIGYIGQLIDRKNVSIILKAVKELIDSGRSVRLKLVGDGPLKEKLISEAQQLNIADFVEFQGFRNDALNILFSMDVFVLPSRMEGIPRCVMEAMAARVPVVGSRIPGTIELIKHGETGYLFDAENSQELTKNLIKVIDATDDISGMINKARLKIETSFSSNRMAKEYYNLFNSLQETQVKKR